MELNVLCTCAFGNIIFNYCYKNKIRMCQNINENMKLYVQTVYIMLVIYSSK